VGGFPANLAAEAGLVTRGLEVGQFQEKEEDGFEKVPAFGANGEESTEPEVGTFDFIEVKGGEVTGARSGDIEAEAELREWMGNTSPAPSLLCSRPLPNIPQPLFASFVLQ